MSAYLWISESLKEDPSTADILFVDQGRFFIFCEMYSSLSGLLSRFIKKRLILPGVKVLFVGQFWGG